MSWRTVVISSRSKLDLKMGYLVVRGEETHRIFLDEISTLIIENPAVSLTGCLLSAMMDKKIKVIFCDQHRSPQSELIPYYGDYDCSRKIQYQISWTEALRGMIWDSIVAEKIRQQSCFLSELGAEKEAAMLRRYISEIEFQDATNREGHAAKVYFNAVFGMNFNRSEDSPINSALNYGYSLILSAFNREIVAYGYLTQLGLHHNNQFNFFNLSCDLMEPFRVCVDRLVYSLKPEEFNRDTKRALLDVLNTPVDIDDSVQLLSSAIGIYVRSVIRALNEMDADFIRFYSI